MIAGRLARALAALSLAAAAAACSSDSEAAARPSGAEAAEGGAVTKAEVEPLYAAGQGPLVKVYKSPTCGCCQKWVEHMQAAGFQVESHDTSDVQAIKTEHGLPAGMASCHTALVDGYVVEGHVPAADIARMLREKPQITGIAAPGMPRGSPGMEGPFEYDKYDVVTFSKDGKSEVFSSHGP